MSNPSKAKGTAWETALVNYLHEQGWVHAERRALHGNTDKGDIAGIVGVVVEAKSCKTLNVTGWVTEAETERDNAGAKLGVAWYKRRGHTSPGKGIVAMSGDTFAYLLREAGFQ